MLNSRQIPSLPLWSLPPLVNNELLQTALSEARCAQRRRPNLGV